MRDTFSWNCLFLMLLSLFFSSITLAAGKIEVDEVQIQTEMNQAVDVTLAGGPFVRLTEENFNEKVWKADRHVLVFFYNNLHQKAWGLASLLKALHQEYGDRITFCLFKMGEEKFQYYFQSAPFRKKYHMAEVPAFIIYRKTPKGVTQVDTFTDTFSEPEDWRTYYNKARRWVHDRLFWQQGPYIPSHLIIHRGK